MVKIEELVEKYGTRFQDLRNQGKKVKECGKILGISDHPATALSKFYGTKRITKWRMLQIPENFSDETKSLIYGTLLGDASIHISGFQNCNKSLTMSHSPKQKEYIEYKIKILKEIKLYPIKETRDRWGTLSTRSVPHPEFDKIYNEFYINGIKEVTSNVLNNLSPEAIAIWFMDDGCARKYGYSIATCAFNRKSLETIKTYFKDKHNIDVKISGEKYLRLGFWSKNALKFRELISNYIIDSMKYKLLLKEGTGKKLGSIKPSNLSD